MSFEKIKDEEVLYEAAAMFAVDLDSAKNSKGKLNPTLVAAAFAEEGVTFDMYTALKAQHEEKKAELEAERLAALAAEEALQDDEDLEPVEDAVLVPKRRAKREAEILVKMDRQNPHFETHGKVFTLQHPFVVMTPDEAQEIFDSEWGFRQATPREAQEYYL